MEILEILARPIFLSWIDWLKMFEQWIEIRHNWHWQNYWFYIPVLPQQARAFLTKAMGCCSSTTSVELPATTERGSFLIAKWFENCGDNRSCDFWVTFVGGDWDSASFFWGFSRGFNAQQAMLRTCDKASPSHFESSHKCDSTYYSSKFNYMTVSPVMYIYI